MRRRLVVLALASCLAPGYSHAFESDVHFGLTKWLALQAGFTPQAAETLATGDQRVDSGDMQYMDLVTAYACFAKNPQSAALAGRHHFPSSVNVPNPPEQRNVIAGGDAALTPAVAATKALQSQAGFLLFKFAATLHALQDSWANQGVPGVPLPFGGAAKCDSSLAWSHAAARGGSSSHRADNTHEWPLDTVAMAKATYDLLQQYPEIEALKRTPKDWNAVRAQLDGFVKGATKTEKRAWFVAHGIDDTSFLYGTSLPDGGTKFMTPWPDYKLPRLNTLQSTQHATDADIRQFFSLLFTQWASAEDFLKLAATFGPNFGGTTKRDVIPGAPATKEELAAMLEVWRIRDHGLVADIAHASKPPSASQRQRLASIVKKDNGLAIYSTPTEAYFPLEVKGPEASPLLGFVIASVEPSIAGNKRAVAMAKFHNAPYDDVVVLAEKVVDRWEIRTLWSTVDH